MLRSIVPVASLFFCAVAIGCDDSRAGGAGWAPVPPEEAVRAREILAAADRPDIDPEDVGPIPLQAVTGLAASPGGLVVGGVSSADDLFWDAWFVPGDGAPPWRLAAVDDLLAVDAGGAIWTTIVSEDESGDATHEVRLSPADGGPSVLLSADLPPRFAAEGAIADGGGGRLLIGTEGRGAGAPHLSLFAVAADGTARRVASDPQPEPVLVLNAALAPAGVYLEILYADRSPTIVKVPLPAN